MRTDSYNTQHLYSFIKRFSQGYDRLDFLNEKKNETFKKKIDQDPMSMFEESKTLCGSRGKGRDDQL